jgi:hypothetical protein
LIDSPQIGAGRGGYCAPIELSCRRESNLVDSLAFRNKIGTSGQLVVGGAGRGAKAMRRAYQHHSGLNLSGWRSGAPLLAILVACTVASSVARAVPASQSADCFSALYQPERRTVADISSGDTLTLTDGTVVRLGPRHRQRRLAGMAIGPGRWSMRRRKL